MRLQSTICNIHKQKITHDWPVIIALRLLGPKISLSESVVAFDVATDVIKRKAGALTRKRINLFASLSIKNSKTPLSLSE